MSFPGGKSFAFSIFDDTDNGTLRNLLPVYDLLIRHRIRTTKSVWVYAPRGAFTGDSLENWEYRDFIQRLQRHDFEIALHGVGDGAFARQEILNGLERYREVTGDYPSLHTNHSTNPDNLYWGPDRFVWPISALIRLAGLLSSRSKELYGGSTPDSPFFWGDEAKRHIKFSRNLTFNGINLSRYDPSMPYLERSKLPYSNYWFSSSDGHTVDEMNKLLCDRNLDQLEKEHGVCIVYTHFGSRFVDDAGNLNSQFSDRIAALSQRNGWFVPVGELLNYLVKSRGKDYYAGYFYLLRLNALWLIDRLIKRVRFGR